MLTTFIIPTIGRGTLWRAINSCGDSPVLVGHDKDRIGEGEIRNRLVKMADTEWVSFLDDDDSVTEDYVDRLTEEVEKNPGADVIIFRQYSLGKQVLPIVDRIVWGNIGCSYSIRTEVAKEFPFKSEPHEDIRLLERITSSSRRIVFSDYMVYRVRH